MKKVYELTEEGKANLEAELIDLKGKRSEYAQRVADARDFGDLSENAEYDAARDDQGALESRIAEIEDILTNVKIIQASTSGKISLGSEIELESNKKIFKYSMVGPVEANPLEGRLSNESPLGKELLGKRVGDKVSITTPKGVTEYEVKSVNYLQRYIKRLYMSNQGCYPCLF